MTVQEEINEAVAKIEGAGIVYNLMIEHLHEELEKYRALGTVEEIIKHRDNLEQENHEYSCLGTLEELKEAMEFKKYFDELYGEGLEIANWHKNGDLEPFDSFYESALDWSEEDEEA